MLYRSVIDDSRIIINLASKEYSKCIEKYLTPQDRYITIVFCELSGDKLVTKGTYAKMARGRNGTDYIDGKIILENPVEIQVNLTDSDILFRSVFIFRFRICI